MVRGRRRRWKDSTSRPVGQAGGAGTGRQPLADPSVEALAVTHLAAMAEQRRDLAIEGVGDVDDPVRARGRHHPELGHRMGLETLVEEFGVGEGVAGVGVGGANGRFPGDEVVGMAGADPVPEAIG